MAANGKPCRVDMAVQGMSALEPSNCVDIFCKNNVNKANCRKNFITRQSYVVLLYVEDCS